MVADDDEARSRELVEAGSEIAGAAAGGALGLIGGPPGVIAGALGGVAVTRAFKWVGGELSERLLSPRQKVRVGAAFAIAADDIRRRLEEGESLRDDGFFSGLNGQRTGADEVLEGVLLTAADSFEERKVKHLGRFYSNLAFEPDVSAEHANFLLKVAQGLTYRQLTILAFVAELDEGGNL